MRRLPKPSPALVVSLVALFFALGGSAFAIGAKELSAQPRCATGAVRGLAVITGAKTDLSGISTTEYTSASNLFNYHWNCTGKAILVKRDPKWIGVDVKFVGNPGTIAIVSSAADGLANGGSVARQPDGSFLVVMGGTNQGATPGPWQAQWNIPFTIALL